VAKRRPPAIERAAAEMGEYFTAWRKVLGLTAAQVADRANVSRTTLRKLEHGDPTVSFETVLRVARGLGILDSVVESIDPLRTDLGRARAGLIHRQRVR